MRSSEPRIGNNVIFDTSLSRKKEGFVALLVVQSSDVVNNIHSTFGVLNTDKHGLRSLRMYHRRHKD